MSLTRTLEEIGCNVVGPAVNVDEGLRLIDEQHPDVALLDIALSGEQSFPIADRLSELGVPFAFVTGLAAEALPARFRQAPMLSQPTTTSAPTRIVEDLIVAGPDPTDMDNA